MKMVKLLQNNRNHIGNVFSRKLADCKLKWLDFSDSNLDLTRLNLQDTKSFSEFVFKTINASGSEIGIGGYLEDRIIYRRSEHFDLAEENRSLHLGVDVWMNAGTPIFTPLDGTIHSFKNNAGFGDYGPTLILEHELENVTFYTLYGHLSLDSLTGKVAGNSIKRGERIGEIGDFPINGDWPPHLHFQIITDLMGNSGDFPGVCKPSEKELYSSICPDPALILLI